MTALFAGGAIIDLILAGMAIEGLALAAYHRLSGRGADPASFAPNLLSGMALLAAMRVLLGGGWWGWASLCLLAALVLHVTDLRRLWQR